MLLKAANQAKSIDASAEAHKKQATEVVAAERKAVRKFGEDEGRRGKDAMDKQAQESFAKGQSKAAGYPSDERGQVQAEAVLKVASEVAAKLREPGPMPWSLRLVTVARNSLPASPMLTRNLPSRLMSRPPRSQKNCSLRPRFSEISLTLFERRFSGASMIFLPTPTGS